MQTSCAACAQDLICGVDAASCWCQSLPNLPVSALNKSQTCLCAACLKQALLQHTILFGISNCDTVKRARAWLAEKEVPYVFWDYKKHGVPADWLQSWLPMLGWQQLVNTRGTTWRKLDETTRQSVRDESSALALMQAQPSVIKRPLMHWRTPASLSTPQPSLSLGFNADHWNTLL